MTALANECTLLEGCMFIRGHEGNCESAHDYVQGTAASDRFPTQQAKTIIEVLLPEWQEEFLQNNAKYRQVQDDLDLGPGGIYPDLNRKLAIIRERVWFNRPTPGEPTKKVIQDMIGHLFLMQEALDRAEDKG